MYRPKEWLSLTGSGRLDHFEQYDTLASPRAAVVVEPRPGFTGKLLYGRGFRVPSSSEYTFRDEALREEQIDSYEAVLEHRASEDILLSVSYYLFEIDDVVRFDIDDPNNPERLNRNDGSVRSNGAEFEVRARVTDVLTTYLGVSAGSAELQPEDEGLKNFPAYQGRAAVTYRIAPISILVTPEVRYQSGALTFSDYRFDDSAVTNLTLSTEKFFGRFDASLSVFNVFDDRFTSAVLSNPFRPETEKSYEEGRAFVFQVRAVF
jgi:outer membrane receptor protein involved in Fe transport